MARILSLLMMLAFVLTNGAAVASAMCQHVDAEAHAYARQSADTGIASEAMAEETAAAALSKKSALADAAGVHLAGFLQPSAADLPTPATTAALRAPATEPAKLASMAISPLLEPPLA